MLESRTIPQYGDTPEDWQRFLYKATKGSYKSHEILDHAEMAYMCDLTGDSSAPETMHLERYYQMLRNRFPQEPPFGSTQQLIDYGAEHSWFPNKFAAAPMMRYDESHYLDLWDRSRTVDWTALINDASLYCLAKWSADCCVECGTNEQREANALKVTAAMLYLSLTWPMDI